MQGWSCQQSQLQFATFALEMTLAKLIVTANHCHRVCITVVPYASTSSLAHALALFAKKQKKK
jgi:hypothetical protein